MQVCVSANRRHRINVVLLLVHRLRRWPVIKTTLAERFVFAGGYLSSTPSPNTWNISHDVHSEAVDWCICYTRKIQHGGDWERSRPQGPKNMYITFNDCATSNLSMRAWTEMLLILKKRFSTWLFPDIFRYDSPKKCSTNLYAVNLWLKPVSATHWG